MADIKEIYEEINQEVVDDITIGATSTSKVAEFRLWEYIFAKASEIMQGLWEIMKGELQATADMVPTCNDAWWDREIRRFQYGHNLVIDPVTKKYSYAVNDEAARIISRVAVVGNRIKVAKDGPTALSVDEYNALVSYKRQVQPTGANIFIVSQDADIIRVTAEIFYDPIIDRSTITTNVEKAINDYLATLAFNVGKTGYFYTTYMMDAIQEVEGVVDVDVSQVLAGSAGSASLGLVDRKYVPVAGYIVVDPANSLSNTLTYTVES